MPVKKKRDRFKGTTEEEVLKRILPDHLSFGLDIVIIGINPGLTAAYVGHYFAGPGNHFWKCLYLSGLIPEPMRALDDVKLKNFGIGFTNIVERTSRGSADLSKKEIKEGGYILQEKIKKYKPKIAVFNGKGIFEVFCGHKKFSFGKQPDHFPECEETSMFVMPSSSARCTQLPRAIDKVPFYAALRKLRDHLRGDIAKLDDAEVTFAGLQLKTAVKTEPKQEPGTDSAPTSKKPKRQKKAGPNVELGTMQHHLIQQAVNAVKMEDGFMPPAMGAPAVDGEGAMEELFPPMPNHPQHLPPQQQQQPQQHQQQQQQQQHPQQQHPQQQHPQHQQHPQGPEGQNSSGGYGMPPHQAWPGNNMMDGKPENMGHAPGVNPGNHGQFYPQPPQNYGPPQPAHSHSLPIGQPQQPGSGMNPPPAQNTPWSAGAPPMPTGASPWIPPHPDYMKHQMHGRQPPPYAFPAQPHLGQPHPGQQHPGQQHMGQQHPDQQHPGQQHPGQQHSGQQHPDPYNSNIPGPPNPSFPYSNPNFLPQMMQQKPDDPNGSRDFGSLPPHSQDSGLYDQNDGKVKNESRW